MCATLAFALATGRPAGVGTFFATAPITRSKTFVAFQPSLHKSTVAIFSFVRSQLVNVLQASGPTHRKQNAAGLVSTQLLLLQ